MKVSIEKSFNKALDEVRTKVEGKSLLNPLVEDYILPENYEQYLSNINLEREKELKEKQMKDLRDNHTGLLSDEDDVI